MRRIVLGLSVVAATLVIVGMGASVAQSSADNPAETDIRREQGAGPQYGFGAVLSRADELGLSGEQVAQLRDIAARASQEAREVLKAEQLDKLEASRKQRSGMKCPMMGKRKEEKAHASGRSHGQCEEGKKPSETTPEQETGHHSANKMCPMMEGHAPHSAGHSHGEPEQEQTSADTTHESKAGHAGRNMMCPMMHNMMGGTSSHAHTN